MLRSVTNLNGFSLLAKDGEIGKVDHLYFDDVTWTIRYLVVNTGNWLMERLVLISPISLSRIDTEAKQFEVSLTKKQVEDSPDIDTHKPVSRQHEAKYLGYYGYPFYWNGPYLWGSMTDPEVLAGQGAVVAEASASMEDEDSEDTHLRSTKAVTGYHLEATDDEIGHVEDFLIDDHTWEIRYLEVDTRNFWPGKKVLISPQWIKGVNWVESKVSVDLSRDAIKSGPEYIYSESVPITQEYERRLWEHYDRLADWPQKAANPVKPTVDKE